MALVGNMIHDAISGNPSVVNYAMFVAVFSMLSLIYLIAATLSEGMAFHPALPLAADALNVLFFLTCGIALAAELKVHSCGDAVCLNSKRPRCFLRTNHYLELHKIQQHHRRICQSWKAMP